jgi:hypothetical protein
LPISAATHVVEGLAFAGRQGCQGGDVGRVVLGDQLGSQVGHGHEVVVLGDEVGFAVDFDQRADVAG